MNKKIFTVILTLLAVISAAAHTTRIESAKGERWWGIYMGSSPIQPFMEPFHANTGDQTRLFSGMMISSLGRYVWSAKPMDITFDGTNFAIISDYEAVEAQKGGKNLREAYLVCCHKHRPPSPGKSVDPMLFDMPYYETRIEFGLSHNAAMITEYAQKLISEGFPKGVIVIADGWARQNGSYDFDPEYYPDPKEFIEELHTLGFKVMLTVTPFTGASGRAFASAIYSGDLLTGSNGKPVIVQNEEGFLACYDLRKPSVLNKIRSRLKEMQSDYGFDGFRFECTEILKELSGQDRTTYLQNWAQLGNEAGFCHYIPVSGEADGQRLMYFSGGDFTGWESLQQSLNNLLSAGLGGYNNCITLWNGMGSEKLLSDDLLMARTLQFTTMTAAVEVMFAPWRVKDRELYAQVKNTLARRMTISSYIKALVTESAQTAEPIIRHMEYAFPKSGFSDCNDQYMIGTKYLIAPMLTAAKQRTVRLPRGIWVDARGKSHRGPVVISAAPASGEMLWFELSKQ